MRPARFELAASASAGQKSVYDVSLGPLEKPLVTRFAALPARTLRVTTPEFMADAAEAAEEGTQ